MFEHALALDPGSVEAQSRLASVLADRVLDFGSNSAEADIKRAEELADQAVAASPRDWYAHYAKGQVLRAQRRCAEAIPEYETALALNRNSVDCVSRYRPVQDLYRADRGSNPGRRSKPSA